MKQAKPFVHPIEEEFARILDYYGIQWEYEPRTFPLAHDQAGNINEAFSPDFYLPGQDLYVELTTLRPELMRTKKRKVRQLKKLYPDINIKLFNRSDLRQMMLKYGLDDAAQPIQDNQAQNDREVNQ